MPLKRRPILRCSSVRYFAVGTDKCPLRRLPPAKTALRDPSLDDGRTGELRRLIFCDRTTQAEALPIFATELAQQFDLLIGFDVLGNALMAHCPAQREHSLEQRQPAYDLRD